MKKIRLLAGCAGVLAAACLSSTAAHAQVLPPGVTLPGGLTTTVNLPDGTKVTTTVTGPTTLTIDTTGGPNPPLKVNITNFVAAGAVITYTGTVTVAGVTSPFDCQVNTSTNTVTGSQYCSTVFGGSSGGGGTTPPTTGGGTVTPPTTGGGTVTTTTGPNGIVFHTITLPNGSTISVTTPQLNLIRNVEAEQFLLSLAAERLTVNNVQAFVGQRLQQLQAAGLAPGGINIGSLYRGRAAGESGLSSGVWADASATDLKDDRIGSGVDGDAKAIAIGGDLSGGAFSLGGFVGYGTMDLSGADAVTETDGFSYGAYGRWSVTPQLNFSLSLGAADQDVYFKRTAGTLVSTGDTDRSSKFGLVGVDSMLPLSDSVLLVPGLTISYVETETDPYIDSNGFPIGGVSSDTTVATLGVTAYYTAGPVLPYISLAASRQLNDVAGIDRSYGAVGAGVLFNLTDRAKLLAGISTLVSKEDERETTLSLTLRQGF